MKFEVKIDPIMRPSYESKLKGNSCGAIDLRAMYSYQIEPGQIVYIATGFSMWIRDPSLVGVVCMRSSTGRDGLRLANGIGLIDSDYQGPINLYVQNMTKDVIYIKGFDRIAQLFLTENIRAEATFVDEFSYITDRGSGGFGSTGKN